METCLVFDTSSVVRKVANRILSSENFKVIEAKSGAETLTLAKSESPDYILIDSNVSDMGRDDLIRTLSTHEDTKKAKLITVLMQVDLATMMRAKRAGSSDFAFKPFNRKLLLQQIGA